MFIYIYKSADIFIILIQLKINPWTVKYTDAKALSASKYQLGENK